LCSAEIKDYQKYGSFASFESGSSGYDSKCSEEETLSHRGKGKGKGEPKKHKKTGVIKEDHHFTQSICSRCQGGVVHMGVGFAVEIYAIACAKHWGKHGEIKNPSRWVHVDIVRKGEPSMTMCAQELLFGDDFLPMTLVQAYGGNMDGGHTCLSNSSLDSAVVSRMELDYLTDLSSCEMENEEAKIQALTAADSGVALYQIEVDMTFDRKITRMSKRKLLDLQIDEHDEWTYHIAIRYSFLDGIRAQEIVSKGSTALAAKIEHKTGAHVTIIEQPKIWGLFPSGDKHLLQVLVEIIEILCLGILVVVLVSISYLVCTRRGTKTKVKNQEEIEVNFLSGACDKPVFL
jgi:hypothetical protein